MSDKAGYVTLKDLRKCFRKAKKDDAEFVGVKIKMEGFPKPEIIINEKENFDKKLEYYMNAYNENLTLKNAPNKVMIIGFAYAYTFSELKSFLL